MEPSTVYAFEGEFICDCGNGLIIAENQGNFFKISAGTKPQHYCKEEISEFAKEYRLIIVNPDLNPWPTYEKIIGFYAKGDTKKAIDLIGYSNSFKWKNFKDEKDQDVWFTTGSAQQIGILKNHLGKYFLNEANKSFKQMKFVEKTENWEFDHLANLGLITAIDPKLRLSLYVPDFVNLIITENPNFLTLFKCFVQVEFPWLTLERFKKELVGYIKRNNQADILNKFPFFSS